MSEIPHSAYINSTIETIVSAQKKSKYFVKSQMIVMLLLLVAMAVCLPSDADPTDPDVGSSYSPTDLSGTVLKKNKKKKKKKKRRRKRSWRSSFLLDRHITKDAVFRNVTGYTYAVQ